MNVPFSAVLRELMAVGVAGDDLVAAIERLESTIEPAQPARSARQERNRRHYEKRLKASEKRLNASEPSKSDGEGEKVSPTPPSKNTPFPPLKGGTSPKTDLPRQAFDLWNEVAAKNGLPTARELTGARRKAIAARLRDGGLERWREALGAVEASRFLTGQTDKGFRADLDFVCQAKSFQRLVEGFYGRDATPRPSVVVPMVPEDPWPRRLAEFRRNAFWNTTDWGPKPGKPGCRVPAEYLTAA